MPKKRKLEIVFGIDTLEKVFTAKQKCQPNKISMYDYAVEKAQMLLLIKRDNITTNKELSEKIGVKASTIQKWKDKFFQGELSNQRETLKNLFSDKRLEVRKAKVSALIKLEDLEKYCLSIILNESSEIVNIKYKKIHALVKEKYAKNIKYATFRKYLMRVLPLEKVMVLKKEMEAINRKLKNKEKKDNEQRDFYNSIKNKLSQ